MLKVKKYVVGFLFNATQEFVCLIEKQRPDWQKGRLNGVGGHIEDGEKPIGAMNREFFEETGPCASWRQFCFIHGSTYELYCFTSRIHTGTPKTTTDEKIDWYSTDRLPNNIIGSFKLKSTAPLATFRPMNQSRFSMSLYPAQINQLHGCLIDKAFIVYSLMFRYGFCAIPCSIFRACSANSFCRSARPHFPWAVW